ncbi:SusC/RagA family TonB-linked outer membrane protein [Algoriphagus aquimarinus]|uniref:TonB-linked outer membrane protein, SusC/RagA family n=1 Tax=Algoriphagus aquimarinus TaxID=237018 RepID=A0A1I1CEQ1_9BACT|nr:TonB-dependent receptor [Algoriphagus aquimarinus]SFB60897.1 TonB-linked outer membrane protein, SusC/RagA family [Algoriphagus aquimarinus]
MKTKLFMLFFSIFCFQILPAFSQQTTVRGKVLDESELPLPGANVLIKGTTVGTVTDMDGNFTINAPANESVIVFSYLGYLSKEIVIGSQTSITVRLEPDLSELDEVIVVGYGTQRKIETTGAIASIKADELVQTPIANVAQGLQGRIAGVQVVQNSSAPGGSVSVRVRGTNSIRGSSEPLYIIDGVQVSNGGGINDLSPLSTINPNDIASVEVLKDASSTAIYGARGANGVVIVTTKRGTSGRTVVTYDGYYGVQQTGKQLEMLDASQFAELENEVYKRVIFDNPSAEGVGTNWQEVIFRDAPIQSHQLSVMGGNQKTQFALSGNFFDQEGILLNSDFKRYSLRINLDHKINDRVKVGTSILGSQNINNSIPTGSTSLDGAAITSSMVGAALGAPPTLQPFDDNGNFWPFADQVEGGYREVVNPLGLSAITNTTSTQRILANLFAEFEIAKGLTYKSTFNAVLQNDLNDYYSPLYIIGEGDINSNSGTGRKINRDLNTLLHESIISYSKRFGDIHSLKFTGVFSTQSDQYRVNQINASGFPNDATLNEALQVAQNITASSSRQSERLDSYMGRVNYGYKDKLFVDLTARTDGSSKFGQNNKYGFFPAVSAAWRVSEEEFFKNISAISDFKIRGSYGLTGNAGAISPYQSLATIGSGSSYNLGNLYATGLAPNGIANPDLRWERSFQTNFGIDLSFLDDRFNFVADYYIKRTEDLLYTKILPQSSGYGSIVGNFAELQNKGLEMSLSAVVINKALNWNVNANISFNRNKVLGLDGDVNEAFVNSYSVVSVGQPLGVFKTFVFDGIYQTGEEILPGSGSRTGGTKVKDINEDGMISNADQVITGNPNPDYVFGISNNLSYKGFDLNFFISGSVGNDIYNVSRYTLENPLGNRNVLAGLADRWSPTNPSQEYVSGFQGGRLPISDRFLEDGTYIRLKNISLGYTLTDVKGFQKIRVYLSSNNLLTSTNYTGYDPEVNSYGGSNTAIGIDNLVYPVAKSYLVGVQISF